MKGWMLCFFSVYYRERDCQYLILIQHKQIETEDHFLYQLYQRKMELAATGIQAAQGKLRETLRLKIDIFCRLLEEPAGLAVH